MKSAGELLSRARALRQTEGVTKMVSRAFTYIKNNYRSLLSPKYLHGQFKHELVIKFDGHTFRFDTTSAAAKTWFYPRYIDGTVHEPLLTRPLIQTLDYDTVFYDIGANIGFFTTIAAEICRDGRAYAFEINPAFAEAISDTVNLTGADNVTIVEKAVSDTTGETVQYEDAKGPISESGEVNGQHTATTVTLDEFVRTQPTPDVLKIDVEGFEYRVLSGAIELFEQEPPETIFLEIHPENIAEYGDSVEKIRSLLDNFAYERTIYDHRGNQHPSDTLPLEAVENNCLLKCTLQQDG